LAPALLAASRRGAGTTSRGAVVHGDSRVATSSRAGARAGPTAAAVSGSQLEARLRCTSDKAGNIASDTDKLL